ncbi:MAG: NADH-quinone oxidoreductase subunit N [Myxococcota bacterium]
MLLDLLALGPSLLLAVAAVAVLLADAVASGPDFPPRTTWLAPMCALVLALSVGASLGRLGADPRALLAGALIDDDFSRAGAVLLSAAGFVAVLLSPIYARHARIESGEYYALLLISVVGLHVMVMAADFMTFFLGLETMSIAVYALTGMRANDARASEAALKYFIVGSFSTGFLLFGIALLYGATGAVSYAALSAPTPAAGAADLLPLGLALVFVGFAFKVAAVPFHMWAPDVYEGAPTPITGFMAVAVKAGAFMALLRLVHAGGASLASPAGLSLLSGLAAVTIVVGNALALVQTSVKRMLAYSSISHAGYLLIGIVAAVKGEPTAAGGVFYYLSAYTFTTLGAFGVLTYLERAEGGAAPERFGAFAGLGFKYPRLGLAMIVFMVALAGMPPTGGFFGKLYVFSAALRAGDVGLALVGVAGSIVGVYYYLKVVVAFYMREQPDPGPLPEANPSRMLGLGLAAAVLATLLLGLVPSPWVRVGQSAGGALSAAVGE